MKLIDVIKSKNGLAYLDKNKGLILAGYNRLDDNILGFNPDKDYGESKFSYKEHVRQYAKLFSTVLNGILAHHLGEGAGKNKEIANHLYYNRVLDFDGDAIHIETDGDISFTPYNKGIILRGWGFDGKGRQSMSMYKFFKKVVPAKFTEKEIKEFCDTLYAEVALDLKVEIVKGEDIGKFYNKLNTSGWAQSSCMSRQPLHRFKMYCDNPDTIELALIKNQDEVVGRFLRWKTNELGWVEDRVYVKSYPVKAWYEVRAKADKAWWMQSPKHFIKGDAEEEYIGKTLNVPVVKVINEYHDVAYLDTFIGSNNAQKLVTN